ncbi:MFS transporter [Paenibacillus chibensis]|uniref:MFS transporter n=1 Tax=Paenibacillus chibensis TaxID=59846 RepID=A0ABU6PNE3_9BACL|nr:MFS transporter [Paenibacillus chibensis]
MLWKEKKYAWLLLIFLWCFGFAGSLSRFVISYYQGELTGSLGVGRDFLGTTWSTATFIGAICAPLGGLLVDRFGVKKVMLLVSCSQILSLVTVLTLRNEAGYFIGNGLFAGFVGLGASTSYVLITGWFQHHRAKALAVLGSSTSLGFAVLVPILANWDGLTWIKVYEVLLLISLLFIPCIVFVLRENKEPEGASPPSVESSQKPDTENTSKPLLNWMSGIRMFARMLRHPVYVIAAFAILTCGISMGTVEMNLVAIHQTAHASTGMISSAMSLLGLLEVFGGITFSFLLDHTSRTRALAILYLLRTVAFTLLIIHFPVSPILFSLIFGATYVGAVPGAILIAKETLGPDKSMGLHTGILLLVHQLGGVLAALGGGFNFDYAHNYQLLIGVNLLLSLVVSAAYFSVKSKARTEAAVKTLAQ